jgi:hypothetical protein
VRGTKRFETLKRIRVDALLFRKTSHFLPLKKFSAIQNAVQKEDASPLCHSMWLLSPIVCVLLFPPFLAQPISLEHQRNSSITKESLCIWKYSALNADKGISSISIRP